MEDNHRLLTTISIMKKDNKASRLELESMSKLVYMLNSGTNDLNMIMNSGQ